MNRKQARKLGDELRKDAKTIFQRQDEWDIICILDACRYDIFEKINFLPGELELAISVGTSTPEWSQNTFKQIEDYSQFVYVTANPVVSMIIWRNFGKHPFLHFNEVWKWGWNDEFKTILPSVVCETAVKLQDQYPGKKMVLHFMQPHFPFVGSDEFKHDTDGGWRASEEGAISWRSGKGLWARFADGQISKARMVRAYGANLMLVLRNLEKLIPQLDGRIVLTSDHGEGFGEFNMYHHTDQVYLPMMLKVPWFVIDREKL